MDGGRLQSLAGRLLGRGGWRRVGGRPSSLVVWTVLMLTMLGAFGGLAFGTARELLAAIPMLRSRPVRALTDGAVGPGLFQGKLRGPERQTPSGRVRAAWIAWIDVTTRSNNKTSTSELCSFAALGGLSLQHEQTELRLELPRSGVDLIRSGSLKGPKAGSFWAMFEPSDASSEPPAALLQEPACARTKGGTYSYFEYGVMAGAEVVVSGCRQGDAVAPCGDGVDFLAARCERAGGAAPCSEAELAVQTLLGHWTRGTRVMAMVGGSVGSGALTAIAIFQLVMARRAERRRRTSARIG